MIKSSNFLPQPPPERIMGKDLLTIGLQEINRNADGLKVSPHKEVVFAIGDPDNPEKVKVAISTVMARVVATRILDMCAVADGDHIS